MTLRISLGFPRRRYQDRIKCEKTEQGKCLFETTRGGSQNRQGEQVDSSAGLILSEEAGTQGQKAAFLAAMPSKEHSEKL